MTASLYGITSANSSRAATGLWGKNQFNSTFPLALCLWMRDQDLAPVTVQVASGGIVTDDGAWSMTEVIGRDAFYEFEAQFPPFARYSRDVSDNIDVVIYVDGVPLRPLEVKLTVVPDSSTVSRAPTEWAPEMVMRPVSSAHAMMSVAASLFADRATRDSVIERLRPAFNSVENWDNATEIVQHYASLRDALGDALRMVATAGLQRPFLLQPLWRTVGQTFVLASDCFDVFVWSDAAVMYVPVDQPSASGSVSRTMRETARHVRALYDLLQTGDCSYSSIYKGMPLGNQTDKAFSLSGRKNLQYLTHTRLLKPSVPREVLCELILDGGEHELKPERRFDAAVQAYMANS